MKKEKLDILITGLLRTEELFKRFTQDLIALRKKGIIDNIIFSTWIGELAKYPEMHSFLKKNKVTIIENEEPGIDKKAGSIWNQMKSMSAGLKYINPNKFVLKTRTDVYINPLFIEKMKNARQILKITNNLPGGNIFKYKIWIPWYELTVPLYLADECFFGLCDDLKNLINYDRTFDTKYNIYAGKSHVRRFIYPFLKNYPILYESLGKYGSEKKIKTLIRKFSRSIFDLERFKIIKKIYELNKFKILKNQLKDEIYLKCLAAYYTILNSHFYIDSCSFPEQVIFREHNPPIVELDDKNIDNNFSIKKQRLPYGGRIYGYNEKLLKNIFNKTLEETEFSNKLMQAINKSNNSITN